jgi:hypothetical protein
MSGLAIAADPCAMISSSEISGMLGTTKNQGTAKLKLPPKATDGKACSYVGKDNSATVIRIQFATAEAAHDYLKTVRDGLEKQSLKTNTEKFDGAEGFSFESGVLAVKKNLLFRVNVNSTAGKILAPDLSLQLISHALRAS